MLRTTISLLATLSFFAAAPVLAQGGLFDNEKEWPEVTDLGWGDERYLKSQVEIIDTLGRQNFGTPVRGDKGDLKLLQRMVYRGTIDKDDKQSLQAMGAVMGNIMAQTHGLSWKVYEDERGRSRAICAQDGDQCLFPITMLSRRLKVGLMADVDDIYSNAMDLIDPYLPQKPYQLK